MSTEETTDPVQDFIHRWQTSGGAELANSQSFLKELCTLLDVPHPDPTQPDESQNSYVFEKAVEFNNGDGTTSAGRIDLFRAGCFVLESKQGAERKAAEQAEALAERTKKKKRRTGTAQRGTPGWEQAMVKARQQAKRYAEAIPGEWPPFLVVVDVGHCFDLYADFTQSGKLYTSFPDPQNFRIRLTDLADEKIRQRLRSLWLEPHELDPSRRSAAVTRKLAAKLAELAKRLEARTDDDGNRRYTPEHVAGFLMRCLFTMFAEDVELIPPQGFTTLLESLRETPDDFAPMVESLWQTMNSGGYSPILRKNLMQFNGGLFADQEALPLTEDQLELLIESSHAAWEEVEPAIFGTLLERALDPVERHKLGAHYTPRAYVERLVMPTLIEPLREQWEAVYATAVKLHEDDNTREAVKAIRTFHEQLCETRVLDPACGSGNFLYVALELMTRLEGEVLNALQEFGERQMPLLKVDPHQFLGIEVNPRAAAITDLVLWIGYLQWHFRTRGKNTNPPEPVIRNFRNIECRDAVLAWDSIEPVFDDEGQPVTRWDGRTTKPHPVTGEEVPDETARVQELRYINPRKAEWPKAEYIVGNPPFVGNWKMRETLGDGYTKAIRTTYHDLPESCDYVMYWWHTAAEQVRQGDARQFGLITTNSLRQTFNRRVIAPHLSAKNPLSLMFAIPDHPWVDSTDGAAVRISMTVGTAGDEAGTILRVEREQTHGETGAEIAFSSHEGKILQNLSIGADVSSAVALRANDGLSCPGVKLHGAGFIVTPDEARELGLGTTEGAEKHIRGYRNGRDLTQTSRGVMVIDLFGKSEGQVRDEFPTLFQRIYERVKPHRDAKAGNNTDSAEYAKNWWLFGKPRSTLRAALTGLTRYIATVETSKHRFFVFLDETILPDNMLISVAADDASLLGVLSSRIHVKWALASGGTLEDRPRYNKTRCFETFPFPDPDEATRQRIRELGEQLDAHRKRQQEQHPKLTMTGMYNVLEKLRAGEELTAKERGIHEQGLVSVLRQIHDDLDAAVFDAYGWPHDLTDEQILEKLVALNAERAVEEARGKVRWLRPEFQNPAGTATQQTLDVAEAPAAKPVPKAKKEPWPKSLQDRFQSLRNLLERTPTPLAADEAAKHFTRARKTDVAELLDLLATLGQARQTDDGRFVA